MRSYQRVGLAVVLCVLGSYQTGMAQDDSPALESGRRSLAFSLPQGGGAEFGIWKMKSERVNRGLFVQLGAALGSAEGSAGENDHQGVSIAVGAASRRYLAASAPVAPFVQSGLRIGGAYQRSGRDPVVGDETADDSWQGFARASLGIGAEWFVHRSASIVGHTGLDLGVNYQSAHQDAHAWTVSLNTFTSTLGLHLYF